MTESQNEPGEQDAPEFGLIPDEDLPDDLQPTDDNPLAKDPDDEPEEESDEPGKVEGMPDIGDPGGI
jgi:hypothetical protein